MFYCDSNMFLEAVSIMFLYFVYLHSLRHLSTNVLGNRYGDLIVKKVKEFEKLDFNTEKCYWISIFGYLSYKQYHIEVCSIPRFRRGLKKLKGIHTISNQVS